MSQKSSHENDGSSLAEQNSRTKGDLLKIGSRTYSSRLFLGSGKFSSPDTMLKAIAKSGTELITMALRRVDLNDPKDDFLSSIRKSNVSFLPNTSGARTAKEAVRISRLAAVAIGHKLVKLELTPEPKHLLPDPIETLKAAEELASEGFEVYPYINADPILAKRLEEIGCACVMPLGAPIGSNRGLRTADQISIVIQNSNIPVIVDAGIGIPSHAAHAMELGADAVLVNTAIATAEDPGKAADAFRLAVISGRLGFLSGLGGLSNSNALPLLHGKASSNIANPSSPEKGYLGPLREDI